LILETPTPIQNAPKKKSKKILLIAILVVVVLVIPTCGVGLFVALTIPALAVAKQDAQDAKAAQVFSAADAAKTSFWSNEGRLATCWDDIALGFTYKGKQYNSPQLFMEAVFGGGTFEIKGIDGATETKIVFRDGRVVFPRGSTLGQPPSKNHEMTKDVSHSRESFARAMDMLDVILKASQSAYDNVDWEALADLSSQSPDKINDLYVSFSIMEKNTQMAVPPLLEIQRNTDKNANISRVGDRYQDIISQNLALCAAAMDYITAYKETGTVDRKSMIL
jgi:hypothetical protein